LPEVRNRSLISHLHCPRGEKAGHHYAMEGVTYKANSLIFRKANSVTGLKPMELLSLICVRRAFSSFGIHDS
jgi:hypothetical protein